MMKKILSLTLSLLAGLGISFSSQASAQDSSFDREFSRFDKDFERLNSWKTDTPASKKLKHAPAPAAPAADPAANVTPLDDTAPAAAKPAADSPAVPDNTSTTKSGKTSALRQGLPKGSKVETLSQRDLLGNQISDPVMRKKVQDLYKRSDVVVQQYVLPTN